MAYDPRIGKLVLFGGTPGRGAAVPGQTALNDTWTYDNTTWRKESPTVSPPARTRTAMAYDEAVGRIVLYGGEDSATGFIYDTWTYDGQTWTQQHPATIPRLGYVSMAYDSAAGKLVLLGTPTSPEGPNETWSYNGTTWTREGPIPHLGPPPRPSVYDAALKKTLLYAGDQSLTYDGTTWTQESSSAITNLTWGMSMTYDPALGQTVLFGGLGSPGSEQRDRSETGPPVNDTWIYNGTNWTHQSPPIAPSPRYLAVMAYSPAIKGLVLFGGADYQSELGDTWTYGPIHR